MNKPPYRIPSIEEINSTPWNGLKVASTFSGGGGSSTGYRWAGYKVVWANEFESNPQATYRLNHPDTILNPRDIKTVTPEEILFVTRLRKGELDIFDGSPPCQGFSIANQNRLKGKAKIYDNGISQKNEDMFVEYVRLLKGLQPKVFIAENVKGLTMGKAKATLGDFNLDLFDNQSDTILHSLMDCGYVVRWQILNAADFGTPQNRLRVFFVGVRKDLNLDPVFPVSLGYQYSVLDALPWLDGKLIIYGCNTTGKETKPNLPGNTFLRDAEELPGDGPIRSITTSGHGAGGVSVMVQNEKERRKFTIQELKRLGGFPDDYQITGSYSKQWEIIGNSVAPPQMMHLSKCIKEKIFDKL